MGLRYTSAQLAAQPGFLGPSDSLSTWYGSGSTAGQAGTGLDQASQPIADTSSQTQTPSKYSGMGQGAMQAMNAGASPAGVLIGAGATNALTTGTLAGAGGAALGAGVLFSMYEQQKKAEAMNEQARVQEAQQRKQDVQMALNQALGATRQLGV